MKILPDEILDKIYTHHLEKLCPFNDKYDVNCEVSSKQIPVAKRFVRKEVLEFARILKNAQRCVRVILYRDMIFTHISIRIEIVIT